LYIAYQLVVINNKIKFMKKITLLTAFAILFLISSTIAQDTTQVTQVTQAPKQSKNISDQLYFGGSVGLSFGSYTQIGLYPLIGYKITPKLSTGVKLTYQYVSDSRYSTSYTTSNYGGSVFARYRIIPLIYAHIEYESINYESYYDSSRKWVPFLFVGGGLTKRMGGNTWLIAQVLFDVIQNEDSPYSAGAPFFSIGVGFGF
jgi:hypothetical protein